MRRVAGAILINCNNQVLAVVTSEDYVNIPMGKEDFDDDLDLKTTSEGTLGGNKLLDASSRSCWFSIIL